VAILNWGVQVFGGKSPELSKEVSRDVIIRNGRKARAIAVVDILNCSLQLAWQQVLVVAGMLMNCAAWVAVVEAVQTLSMIDDVASIWRI
jgi:hypothetical protein